VAFDRGEFYDTLDDIEKYLGYLKGNETAHDYLMTMWGDLQAQFDSSEGHVFTIALDWEYEFPCPEGRFKVHPGAHWNPAVKQDVTSGRLVDWDAYVKEVQHQTDLAYKEGTDWAAGTGDYLGQICAQFIKPDVTTLRDTILDLHRDVVTPLVDAPNDDWAHLGGLNLRWTGAAAASFNDFYTNYNDALARSGLFANLVNVGFASSARVISSAQLGALEFVTKVRDGLVAQLDQWASTGWKPLGPPPSNTYPEWVTDLGAVAENAVTVAGDYVPGVKDVLSVRDNVKNIAGLVGSVADLAGVELPHRPKAIPVRTSDEIYKSVADSLNDDYLHGFAKAMDRLDTGGPGGGAPDPAGIEAGAFSGQSVVDEMREDKGSGNWYLPDVSGSSLKDDNDHY
jgi:hypothetical protein